MAVKKPLNPFVLASSAMLGVLVLIFAFFLILPIFDPFWDCAYDEKIDGHYRLQAGDTLESMGISYCFVSEACIVRIPNTVISYGINGNYIVAAVRRERRDEPHVSVDYDDPVRYIRANKTMDIEYYYIIKKLDFPHNYASTAVRGPLTEEAFGRDTVRLRLPAPDRRAKFSSQILAMADRDPSSQ